MRVSIVIPCWRDRDAVEQLVQALRGAGGAEEIVIADATPEGREWQVDGAVVLFCDVAGRGIQMNAGAAVCRGDVVVFNHADSKLTGAHLESLRGIGGDVVGGGFQKAFATHHPKMRWLEPFVRWYSGRWGILYGDHSVFVRREVFEAMGGFAAVKLMEDVDFSDRIRQEGKVVLLDPPLETSMRRFKRRGYLKNRLQNLLFVWLWRMRLADDKTLYRWYYRSG